MSEARNAILSSIRSSLGRGPLSGNSEAAQRLNASTRNLIPKRAIKPHPELVELFIEMAGEQTATIDHISQYQELPSAVARYLKERELPFKVAVSKDPQLLQLAWETSGLEITAGPASGHELVSVTPVFAGIAETGTLCVTTGAQRPYTLNMLPDHHIAVVRTSRIVGAYEDCWDWIKEQYGAGVLPRTVLWITGTSLTGDIEQTLQRGAHGPRKVHIILMEDGETHD